MRTEKTVLDSPSSVKVVKVQSGWKMIKFVGCTLADNRKPKMHNATVIRKLLSSTRRVYFP